MSKGPLMNLVLVGQVKTGQGGYSIPITAAVLDESRLPGGRKRLWLNIRDKELTQLNEAIFRAGLDRYWLEGRNYA